MVTLSEGYDFMLLEIYEENNGSRSDRALIDSLAPNSFYGGEAYTREGILNDDGDLMGAMITEIIDNSLHIHYLYIRHDMRGLGFGKNVLLLLSERCIENKLDYISCVAFTNASEQFFLENNFVISGDNVTLIFKPKKKYHDPHFKSKI